MPGTDAVAIPDTITGPTRLFVRNMAALWRSDPALAQQVDDLPDSLLDALTPTKAGPPSLALSGSNDRPVWLHSRYDPCKQAEQFAQSVDPEKPTVVLTGMGLGYPAEAVWKRMKGRCFLVVLEPDIRMIFRALHCADLSKPIREGRLVFLTHEGADILHNRLEPQNLLLMAGTQIITFEPGMQLAGDFHKRMSQRITDFVTYLNMSLRTIFGNARVTIQNLLNNLPTYMATPPIDILRNRFAGCPGILVAAGPSLRKHLPMLADLQGRAVISCVQTVFKTLLAGGVTPHFVTSLDYSELGRRFFEGIKDCRDVHLIAEPKAGYRVIDAYRGPLSLLYNDFAKVCLGDDLGTRGGLRAGATVAHLAFYVLEYLGCDPIILIGQDLAFSDGLYYAPGVAAHEVWQAESNRYHTLEMMEWERVARQRPILHPATDIHGQPVYTDETMLTYLQQFERDFAACRAAVIDASEGGLPKRGARLMTFRDAVDKYCRNPIPADALAYRRQATWWDGSRLPLGRERIEEKLEQVEDILRMFDRTAADLRELDGLLDRDVAAFNRAISKADRARVSANKNQVVMRMVSELAQLAEYRRVTADRLLEGQEDLPDKERARRQLQRDTEFNRGMTEAGEMLRDLLRETIKRFDEVIAARGTGGQGA